MLHLFFIVVFIAEVIIGCWVISKIKEWDNNVNKLNAQVIELRPQIQSSLLETKLCVNKTMTAFAGIVTCIAEKREECKKFFSKSILSVIGSAVLKIPFSKILSILEIALTLKKMFRV